MRERSNRPVELDGRRAISVARAAHLYDMTTNTMRKILREAGVLIEMEKMHRVLCEDLIRVIEGSIAPTQKASPRVAPLSVSDSDRAAFLRASQSKRSA